MEVTTINSLGLSPFLCPILFRHDDTDAGVLERISVYEALSNSLGKAHDLLNLLWGNIFALRKLE